MKHFLPIEDETTPHEHIKNLRQVQTELLSQLHGLGNEIKQLEDNNEPAKAKTDQYEKLVRQLLYLNKQLEQEYTQYFI